MLMFYQNVLEMACGQIHVQKYEKREERQNKLAFIIYSRRRNANLAPVNGMKIC